MPVLYAEAVSAEARVGASPAKRTARAVTTGLTVNPAGAMRKTRAPARAGRTVEDAHNQAEVRESLTARRAKITPGQAGQALQ